MRRRAVFAFSVLLFSQLASAHDPDRDFSGAWRLNPARSDIRERFDVSSGFLRVTQNATLMTVAAAEREDAPALNIVYPVTNKPERSRAGKLTFNIAAKWEGAALLANVIGGGPRDYTIFERWSRSRDGARLTITRTNEGQGGSSESTFEYDNPESAPPPAISENRVPAVSESRGPAPVLVRRAPPQPDQPAPSGMAQRDYVLPPGTRILLRLTNAVNTKRSKPGDRIYLQTAAPVFSNGTLVIPPGSYVTGTITESKGAGRVKGRSGLNFRFEDLTLPNGVARDFLSRAGSVDTQGNLDRNEGRIEGNGTKGKDAATVARTTAGGTGIGTIAGAAAGNVGMGMGIGAAAGAVAGLAGVFASRGQEVVIPQGTTMEMVLDRELRYTGAELFGRVR